MADSWTILKVLDWTTQRFQRAEIEGARLEAQILLAHVLDCDRMSLYTRFDKPLLETELAAYRELIKRRLAGEPVAYLVGEAEFWSRPFWVDNSVLIPRPDTETLIELVLDETPDRGAELRIADVATGSGVIAVTLAAELPAARVVATDLSPQAVALAGRNAERHQIGDRLEVRQGSLLDPLAGQQPFGIIVSNPPYVPTGDLAGLDREVQKEPRLALDGGEDGLDLIRQLAQSAARYLVSGGLFAMEHGYDQADRVRTILDATGSFTRAATRADLGKRPRVTWARAR